MLCSVYSFTAQIQMGFFRLISAGAGNRGHAIQRRRLLGWRGSRAYSLDFVDEVSAIKFLYNKVMHVVSMTFILSIAETIISIAWNRTFLLPLLEYELIF